jgi:hypothetical protein
MLARNAASFSGHACLPPLMDVLQFGFELGAPLFPL